MAITPTPSTAGNRVVRIGTGLDFGTLEDFRRYLENQNLAANGEMLIAECYEPQALTTDGYFIHAGADDQHFSIIRPVPGSTDVTLTFPAGRGASQVPGIRFDNFLILCPGNDPGAGPAMKIRQGGSGPLAGYKNCVFSITSVADKVLQIGESYAPGATFDGCLLIFEAGSTAYLYDLYGSPPVGLRETAFISLDGRAKPPIKTFEGGTMKDCVFSGFSGPAVGQITAGDVINNYSDSAADAGKPGISVAASGSLMFGASGNYLPKNPGPLIGAGSAEFYNTYDMRGVYRGEAPDVGPLQAVAQAAPVPPTGRITSVETRGQKRIVKGSYTSFVTAASVALAPAPVPNGATAANGSVTLDIAAKTFTAVVTGTPGNYLADRVVLSNTVGDTTVMGDSAFTIAVPDVPTIQVTGQTQNGATVTVYGTHTGYPVSGTFTLTADADANGATSKSPVDIVFSDDGNWSATVTNVAYGRYANSPATATNFSGTATAHAPTLNVYAPGGAPPGLPAVALPNFVTPSFDSPSLQAGAVVTTIVLENTVNGTVSGQPFTIGHVFKQGQLKPSDTLAGKIAGQADLQLQFDFKASWPDGSVRHAVISGLAPELGANELKNVALVRSTAAQDRTALSQDAMAAAGIDLVATSVIDGVIYTADANAALLAGKGRIWLSGPIVTEYLLEVPFKTSTGTMHPVLKAQFAIRYYPAVDKAKVDVTYENGDAYSPVADITNDVSIAVGGQVAYSRAGLVHWYAGKWKKTFWYKGETALHIRFDKNYLLDSRVFPNYDRSLTITEAFLQAQYVDKPYDFEPMRNGPYSPAMGETGGRQDIALHPGWAVNWLLTQDKRARRFTLLAADISGSWCIHLRDRSAGPGAGYPINVMYFPYAGTANPGDTFNPATGQYEHLQTLPSAAYTKPDNSHVPNFSGMAYLLTGDYFYLDDVLSWAAWLGRDGNPNYREFYKGLITPMQVRGQAWGLRTVADAAAALPDAHPQKPVYQYFMDQNLDWYNARYSNNDAANKLGIIVNGSKPPYNNERDIAPWQDDFFTSAAGYVHDLGFTKALPLLAYKVKFPILRMVGQGMCWISGAMVQLTVRDSSEGVIYQTIGESYQKTRPDLAAMACNGPEMMAYLGRPIDDMGEISDGPLGYPSNMQPALAYASDFGGLSGKAAWTQFMSRSIKPDYAGTGAPQFDIVPRTTEGTGPLVTSVVVTPDVASGSTQFSATVNGFNSPPQDVTWTASAGQVDTDGYFSAPDRTNVEQVIIVTATSTYDPTQKGSATVTIPALGSAPVRTVTLVLRTASGLPVPNLSGLKWAVYAQPTPDASQAPVAKGANGTTDTQGVFSIAYEGALPAGGLGRIEITESDGTVTQDPPPRYFAGVVEVA